MDYTVHGILQARILEWVTISFLQGILLTQELNPGLPYCKLILFCLSHRGTHSSVRVSEKTWSL